MRSDIPRPEDRPTQAELKRQDPTAKTPDDLDFELATQLKDRLEALLKAEEVRLTSDGTTRVELDVSKYRPLESLIFNPQVGHPNDQGWYQKWQTEIVRRKAMLQRGAMWHGWKLSFGAQSIPGGWSMTTESSQPDTVKNFVLIRALRPEDEPTGVEVHPRVG